jgi:hypothetical protein
MAEIELTGARLGRFKVGREANPVVEELVVGQQEGGTDPEPLTIRADGKEG